MKTAEISAQLGAAKHHANEEQRKILDSVPLHIFIAPNEDNVMMIFQALIEGKMVGATYLCDEKRWV